MPGTGRFFHPSIQSTHQPVPPINPTGGRSDDKSNQAFRVHHGRGGSRMELREPGQSLREVRRHHDRRELAGAEPLPQGRDPRRRVHRGDRHRGRDRRPAVPEAARSAASGDVQGGRRVRRRLVGRDVEGRVRLQGSPDPVEPVLHQRVPGRSRVRHRRRRRRVPAERRRGGRQEGLHAGQVRCALRHPVRGGDLHPRLSQGHLRRARASPRRPPTTSCAPRCRSCTRPASPP